MNHVRKMSLIPSEMVDKMKFEHRYNQASNPSKYRAMAIDRDMESILSRSDIGEKEKAILYSQLLRKYLDVIHPETPHHVFTPHVTHPIEKVESPDDSKSIATPSSTVQGISSRHLLKNVPKYSQTKARRLLTSLENDANFVWNGDGEISIGGHLIKGSNIRDIIRSSSSNSKVASQPIGLESVLAYLKDNVNLSDNMITNRFWKQKLNIVPPSQKPSKPVLDTPLSTWMSPATRIKSASLGDPISPLSTRNSEWETWDEHV